MGNSYYSEGRGSKLGDFFLGIIYPIGILLFTIILASLFSSISPYLGTWVPYVFAGGSFIGLLYLTFFVKRYYIGLGILALIAAAFILGGSCFLMLNNWH